MAESAASCAASEPQTMSVRELKEELKVGGVNTSGMLEKEDLVVAVKTLRDDDRSPPGKKKDEGETCAHCGKRGAALKRCLRCTQVSYCGAECQKLAWKGHKKTCEPPAPLPVEEVILKVSAAHVAHDWREVLKWEGRMEQLLQFRSPADCDWILTAFTVAHEMGMRSKGTKDHAFLAMGLEERRVVLLGKVERFRDQGAALCSIAQYKEMVGERKEGERYFKKARDLGAAHGFFSVECQACLGLGQIAKQEGRLDEALELLRNAFVAANLSEDLSNYYEVNVLQILVPTLLEANEIDEVEPLVPRLREAAQAESRVSGRLAVHELRSCLFSARLHEVLCLSTLCWEPRDTARPLHSTKIDAIWHALHRPRIMTRALFEPPAFSRHADGPRRPRGRCALCSTSYARTGQQCKT